MKYYQVTVNILTSDEKGTFNSEDFEYNFQESLLIEARNKAISKVKDLLQLFNNEMPEGSEFSSPVEAELRGFKDFNAYSIDLSFIPEEGYEYQIYGEEELTIEALEVEARYYDGNIHSLCEIEDLYEDMVEVLESDLEFFLN